MDEVELLRSTFGFDVADDDEVFEPVELVVPLEAVCLLSLVDTGGFALS